MRDLVQFVRQLWEDRLLSLEDFTKEHGLSIEDALKLRNRELEGCMKDLETQTDALLDALEEADSLLASPRKSEEKIYRKLALGECLKRLGKQEEEATQHYDAEKVAFLQQARQLLIDSFRSASPVLSETSIVGNVPEDEATECGAAELASEEPARISTEEQTMQTDETPAEEAATQTRKLIAKKSKSLKEPTDKVAAKIEPTADRSRSPTKPPPDATAEPSGVKKPKKKPRRSVSPRYINERLGIRAPSPRRRLPWESPTTEEEADDGYTSNDLIPAVPPQPHNSTVSLADPDDEFQGFITAEETVPADNKLSKKSKSKSKSPKGKRNKEASKSPKRRGLAGAVQDSGSLSLTRAGAAAANGGDMGQGEGARPRRRRSKTQRTQMKGTGADLTAHSSDEEEGEQQRRRTAEPHGDGGRGTSRRQADSGKQPSPSRGAARRPGVSPQRRTTNQVYHIAVIPQPDDPLAGSAATAASDSKLMRSEGELGAKERTTQPRAVRRKRCSGGGDTMSVQSFNSSTEESRGRPESARQLRTPVASLSPPRVPPVELGAVGGEEPGVGVRNPAAGFPWDTSHLVYQPDPFCGGAGAAAELESPSGMWAYRCHQQDRETDDMLPLGDGLATDDAKARQASADDSGFQSEPAARSLTSFRSEPYVPPLSLQQTPDSAPRPKSDLDVSATREPSAGASARSPITSPNVRSPRSPSRSRLLTNSTPLERSTSCEIPHKKQRRADERPSTISLHGCGDQPAPLEIPPPAEPAVTADQPATPAAVTEEPASVQPQAPPPPAEPVPPPATIATPDVPPTEGAFPIQSPDKTSDQDSSDFRDCEEGMPVQPQMVDAAVLAVEQAAEGTLTAISPTLLVKDYEQLQESLVELKQMQTKFQKDFAANEYAKEMTTNLQSDIQRLESSIQELQGIVSQEYEQTRQDHDETRAAIEAIETRVDTGERTTHSQLEELRSRIDQIAQKFNRLEAEAKKDTNSLDKDALAAPNVMTLSSMLNRLETEVITLRHEVDSNRHSIDSITSVTQLDSPKPSPLSAGVVSTSDWQQTTERTDVTKRSVPEADLEATRSAELPAETLQGEQARNQQHSRPDDLDSFKDSQSDMSGSEASLGGGQQAQRSACPQQQQQTTGTSSGPAQAQSASVHRHRIQSEQPRRPPAVSPLRMGSRRSGSHQPEVLQQLRQMHLMPPAAPPNRPAAAKRSRSAAPQGARDESDELRDYWAQDLSTASASTEPPLHDESTRAHHGSSRATSRNVYGAQSQPKCDIQSDAFLAKIDAIGDPSDKLDHLQNKLLDLRHRVLLSMYRRQRRRAVSEGPRAQHGDQQRRRAQLAAIDRRLRHRIHGWNRRLLADVTQHRSPTGGVVSEESSSAQSQATSEAGGQLQPAAASRRAATEYLTQLSYMLAADNNQEGRKIRDGSRGRQRTHSPPTKDPSSLPERRSSRRHPPPVDMDGSQMQRFARNESKLVELQTYLGGIRQHLQKMALDLDSPPSRPRPAPAGQGVVFSPWQHQQTARGRSVSIHRRPTLSMRF